MKANTLNKTITRRKFLGATLGSVGAMPLLFRNVQETLAAPQMDAARDHRVRLNMNENPFGPSPKAMLAVMKNLYRSNAYLYPTIEKLYGALMQHHGIARDMIILGTGSWEVLCTVPLPYYETGGNFVSTRETFELPLIFWENLGLTGRKADHIIDPEGRWQYDVDGLLAKVDSRTRFIYLVNPNNPTGAWLNYQQLKYMIDSLPPSVLFLIDEAYIEFLGDDQKNGLDLVQEGYENLLVTRTFSKIYGLAGLRIGYGVAHPDVISRLQEFAEDFLSINTSGFYGAIAALEDTEFVAKTIGQARKTRSFYKEWLTVLGFSHVMGAGPFVMVDVHMDADIIVERMAEQNVLVAGGKDWEMPSYIRISYGTDVDNLKALRALCQSVSESRFPRARGSDF